MSQNDDKIDQLHSMDREMEAHLGIAGRTARFFIQSPLTPLLYIAMLLMGLMGLAITPRQEDPEISVPMVDIFVQYPGAAAKQVSALAIQPLERIMSEIPGVKHVYSAAQRGGGMVTIQFKVGQEMGPSLVKVNDKLDSNMDLIPPGVMPPLVKAKGIDDVPVVTLTLWSKDLDNNGVPDVDDGQLRMLANDVLQTIKELPNTGNGFVVGGRREQVTVEVSPERLAGFGISLDQVANTIRTANSEQQAGGVEAGSTHFNVVTGSFLKTVDDINRLVVGTHKDVPVYVHDVAKVKQGPEDAKQLVGYYTGPASDLEFRADGVPAVTIAVAKKKGSNGITVVNAVKKRVAEIQGTLIPDNVQVSITRDYGKTAEDKVNELIFKLFVATGFVFFLILGAFRAFRPAIVVLLVIPVVLLMTIFMAWVTDYSINRVSLFALIFSIGILVDDAIVVIENIYRRWLEEGETDVVTAVDAVREVGNPTILATFTVIAALLPMGFVSGMMGPYMEPIPALGSVAMLISVFAAFVFTPYFTMSHWLRPSMRYLQVAGEREHKGSERLESVFRRTLTPLVESPYKARLFRLVMWGAFLFACSFFYFKWVAVKMLPLDNKPEFSVVLDMPEGTALPVTANLAHRMAEKIRTMPEVTAIQVYAGTSRPFDFNGMVRHYYLRKDPWQAEVQVQLLDKTERDRTSHEIAVQARQDLAELVKGTGAKYAVVEMPPGPPVLEAVVAEVHGPSAEIRRQVAKDLTDIFAKAESLRDVDNYMRDTYYYWRFTVDSEKAVRRGISVDTINRNLGMALGGGAVGDVKQRAGHEPVNIVIQVPLAERSQITRLGDLPIQSTAGITVPLRELGRFERVKEDDIIFKKDLRGVEYVVADVGGHLAAPVYGMFQVQDLLKSEHYRAPDGVELEANWIGPPENDASSAFEWAGEWTVTYETFRDMGAAFMVALVLIYILVVWEFGNFRIPALIMAPIPLTLLGIIPAHMLFFQMGWGGEFTATSMIGWIALAGIIVRNSILLVDFSIHEVQHGSSVVEAVIQACKARTRPIVITALALVCGSSVIFFDPIFQGMAISLASGVLVSTALTLIVIPLGCIQASKDLIKVAAASAPPGFEVPVIEAEEVKEGKGEDELLPPVARTPLWMRLWSKVAGALMLVFYLFRGLFLLFKQIFSRRGKKVEAAPAGGSGTSSSGGTGSAGGSSSATPGGTVGRAVAASPVTQEARKSSDEQEALVVAAVSKETTTKAAGDGEEPPVTQAEVTASNPQASEAAASPSPAETAGSQGTDTQAGAVTNSSLPDDRGQQGPVDGQSVEGLGAVPAEESGGPRQEPAVGSAPKTRRRPSTLTKQTARKAKSGATASTRKKSNGAPAQRGEKKPAAKASSKVSAIPPVRKKASRRGIRLKT